MAAVIFNSDRVQSLKNALKLGVKATIWSDSTDPTAVATLGTIGDLYIQIGTPNIYQKITTSATDTNWRILLSGNTTDIPDTTFSAANNTASQNVTGLAFSNTTVRAFTAYVSVTISATSSLYQFFTLSGIQRGSDWVMDQTSSGDLSLVTFSITNAGQIQASTGNYSGFSSAKIEFRAITLLK